MPSVGGWFRRVVCIQMNWSSVRPAPDAARRRRRLQDASHFRRRQLDPCTCARATTVRRTFDVFRHIPISRCGRRFRGPPASAGASPSRPEIFVEATVPDRHDRGKKEAAPRAAVGAVDVRFALDVSLWTPSSAGTGSLVFRSLRRESASGAGPFRSGLPIYHPTGAPSRRVPGRSVGPIRTRSGDGAAAGTPTIPRSRCERSAAFRPAALFRPASPPRRPHLRRRLALRRA